METIAGEELQNINLNLRAFEQAHVRYCTTPDSVFKELTKESSILVIFTTSKGTNSKDTFLPACRFLKENITAFVQQHHVNRQY